MKKKTLYVLLTAEALICLGLCWGRLPGAGLTSAAAFPFESLGLALRRLSLSGEAGNAAAVILYGGICLLPLGLVWKRRKRLYWADWITALMPALLFYVMYMMINPQLIAERFAGEEIGKAVLGGTVYSVVICYVLARLLRYFSGAEKSRIIGALRPLLAVLAAIFIYAAFGLRWRELFAGMEKLREGNTDGGLGVSYAFLGLRYVVSALPYLLDAVIALRAAELAGCLGEGYGEKTVAAAERLSALSFNAMTACAFCTAGLNLLQLCAAGVLRDISGSVEIPVGSICFALGALLLARMTGDNRRLQDDNDLFI